MEPDHEEEDRQTKFRPTHDCSPRMLGGFELCVKWSSVGATKRLAWNGRRTLRETREASANTKGDQRRAEVMERPSNESDSVE